MNGNKLSQLNSKTNKNNTKSEFNNIITDVVKKLLVTKQDKSDDNIIFNEDKYFKLPFKSKFNDFYPVMESVTTSEKIKNQHFTESLVSVNTYSSNESGMKTKNKVTMGTKNFIPLIYIDHDKDVRSSEGYQDANSTKLINMTKPTSSTEMHVKSVTSFENGLEENAETNTSYVSDIKSTIFQTFQKPQNSTDYEYPITFYDSLASKKTYPAHNNNDFKIETELEIVQNLATENLPKDSSGKSTTDSVTEMPNINLNINNNTIDYTDSRLKMTENIKNQRDNNNNIEEPSVITKDNYQISNTIRVTPSIKKIIIWI